MRGFHFRRYLDKERKSSLPQGTRQTWLEVGQEERPTVIIWERGVESEETRESLHEHKA